MSGLRGPVLIEVSTRPVDRILADRQRDKRVRLAGRSVADGDLVVGRIDR